MKIAIFGTLPPPYGGRSIHVKRLMLKLRENSHKVLLFTPKRLGHDTFSAKKISNYFTLNRVDVVHSHDKESWKRLLLLVLFKYLFKYKIILTIHSFRENISSLSGFRKLLVIFITDRIDFFICVGENEKKKLQQLVDINKIEVIPAIINPIEDERDVRHIPQNVIDFIEHASFLISANGAIRIYKNEDLYGLDMLIELMANLKENKLDVQLLFCVLSKETQQSQEKELYQTLKKRIIELQLERNIMLYEVDNTEFYPILKRSSLFIRPTNTDGDSVSIREALFYGVPSISSNIVSRPEGTILFENRNQRDLIEKVMHVLEYYQEEKVKASKIDVKDYFYELYCVYKKVIEV